MNPDVLLIGPYPAWDLDALARDYEVHRLWEARERDTYIAENAAKIRAIATRGDLGAAKSLIDALPALEIIACYGVGTDAIDLTAARARGIAVTNTPDVLTADVADMAMALMLGLLRRIPHGDAHVRSGEWSNRPLPLTTSLTGKTVGILGFGRIGQAVASRAAAFGTTVLYTARKPVEGSPYEWISDPVELARRADILIITIAGGAQTRHIVDNSVLTALGPDGVLINVSRGSTVDEEALIAALRDGRIAGAGLDVFANEPGLDERFKTLENVVLHPHHASGTVETRRAMGALVRNNLAAHFAGKPLLTPVP